MKKRNVIWICLLIIVGVLAVYNVVSDNKDKNEKEELASLMSQSYDINGVKYLSYSQLKYIALNELSHEEVGKIVSMCGLTQTEISGSSSRYKGDCGDVSLQIIKGDRTQYNFDFHPRSKEYMKILKAEIMREEDSKDESSPTRTRVEGYTNGYWFVQLSYTFDKDDDMSFFVFFWDNKKYRQ